MVATSYLLGGIHPAGREARRLAGLTGLPESQVSLMAEELDEMVEGFRSGRWTPPAYTFLWLDALTQKVREGGRTVNVHTLIATAVSANGKREVLGIDVAPSEDGAGWRRAGRAERQ